MRQHQHARRGKGSGRMSRRERKSRFARRQNRQIGTDGARTQAFDKRLQCQIAYNRADENRAENQKSRLARLFERHQYGAQPQPDVAVIAQHRNHGHDGVRNRVPENGLHPIRNLKINRRYHLSFAAVCKQSIDDFSVLP